MASTVAEKILGSHADRTDLSPGDIALISCDLVLANDVSGPVTFSAFERMGATRVFDPARVVMVADHFMPAKDVRSAELQKRLREWSHDQQVVFFDQGRGGIEHAVLIEEGFVRPGMVIVGGDSHTCTYGALGAFGTGLGSTDIACALALGQVWQQVPATIEVELRGSPAPFVTGKDVILSVLDRIGVAGGLGCVLEFTGDGVDCLNLDERRAVANMAVEAGAETGLLPVDHLTEQYLAGLRVEPWSAVRSDPDAQFEQRITIELPRLEPLIAMPSSPGNVAPLHEASGQPVHQVYIGNCSNGTITDLRQAAAVLDGKKVHPRTRAIVVPSSQRVYRQAIAEGLVDILVTSGVVVSTPTCGACFGGHMGILANDETAVATTNRNFRGRMGSTEARIYLANASVAAAAAVAGEIIHPAELTEGEPR